MNNPKTKKQLTLFLLLTFGISWTFMIALIMPAALKLPADATLQQRALVVVMEALVMFVPAVSALLTRLITHDWTDCKLVPHFRGRVRWYLWGWFGPMLFILIGVAFYFLLFPGDLSWEQARQNMNAPSATPLPATVVPGAVQLALLMLVCPLLNAVNCFGEEWGWRGFLFPKLMERDGSFVRSAIVAGLIWGIWHAPIIAVGHNYQQVIGTDPWWMVLAAIAAMCMVCVVLSLLFCYIAYKADAVWPAVLAHGALNGTAGFGIMLLANPDASNAFIGPSPTGIVGGAAFVVAAVWVACHALKRYPKPTGR